MFSRVRAFFYGFDWLLFASMFLVLSIGLATLYSIAVGREGGNLFIFQKQLIIALLGVAVFFLLSMVDYHTWESSSRWLYFGTIIILVSTLFFGQVVNGTRGWLGVGDFRFQPVELAKLVGIIILAAYFSRRARQLDKLSNLIQSLFLAAIFIILIFFQPDFGSAMLILLLWLGLVLTIGVRRRYLIGLAGVGILVIAIGWLFVFEPYQKERLLTFWGRSNGLSASSYNVRQATIAVGSGGLMGRGLGEGSQSQLRFLPEAETDFIFAVVAEELGFLGISILFGLLALLYYRLFRLLSNCQDWFASFVVLGTIILLSVEIFINSGMAMGIVPVVGIPFPFLSAGGSSLLIHLALLGIVQNIARFEGNRGYQISRVSTV